MELNGERFNGFEHSVFLDRIRRIVSKIPGPRSIFKDKDANMVRRGLDIQASYDTPIIHTLVRDPRMVSYIEGKNGSARKVRKLVEYLLLQPLADPSHEMTYSDLHSYEKYRELFKELVMIRREIARVYGLGLDLLGGQGFSLIRPALDPRVEAMTATLGNVLVADDDVYTNGCWEEETSESNRLVARKGEVRLCDTTLMPIGRGRSPRDILFAPAMAANDRVQTAILEGVLESLDVKMPPANNAKSQPDTKLERFSKWVVRQAVPKMRAFADAQERAA